MKNISESRTLLQSLLEQQSYASMATLMKSGIHSSLVAYAVSQNLEHLIICTPRATRKYNNILQNSAVSLLIDNTTNMTTDLQKAMAVTVTGTAEELSQADVPSGTDIFLKRHPYMSDFVQSPNTAVIKINVAQYDLVCHFQDVTTFKIKS